MNNNESIKVGDLVEVQTIAVYFKIAIEVVEVYQVTGYVDVIGRKTTTWAVGTCVSSSDPNSKRIGSTNWVKPVSTSE